MLIKTKTVLQTPSKGLIIADPGYMKNVLDMLSIKNNYKIYLDDYGVFIPTDGKTEVSIIKNEQDGIIESIIIEYQETNKGNLLEIEAGMFSVDSGSVTILDVEELKKNWIDEEDGYIYKIRITGNDSEKIYDLLKDKYDFKESHIEGKRNKEYLWHIGNNKSIYEEFKKDEYLLKEKFNKLYRNELEEKLKRSDLSKYDKLMIEEKLLRGNYQYHLTEFPFNSYSLLNREGLFSINNESSVKAFGANSGHGDGLYSAYNYYDNKNQLVKTIIKF